MNISFLKAFNGDSILLSYQDSGGKPRNIVIDSGPSQTYQVKGKKGKIDYGEFHDLVTAIKSAEHFIDLLILTHVDDDHIDGVLSCIKNDSSAHDLIGKVWFNSGKIIADHLKMAENPELEIPLFVSTGYNTSVDQGVTFNKWLNKNNLSDGTPIYAGLTMTLPDLKFDFLSPDTKKLERFLKDWKKEDPNFETSKKYADYSKTLAECLVSDEFEEDNRAANGSSLAFILTYNDIDKYLFLGDSHPTVVLEQLAEMGFNEKNPLPVKFVKISHHGSKKNTSSELLRVIDTNKYVISAHGLNHGHPDKVLLARIINHNPMCRIYFNYPDLINRIFTKQDYQDFTAFRTFDAKDINKDE
jgi:beta-lactamase superfamily II metal-dependent hydrolase